MRHGRKVNKLGRTHAHRTHMLSNMATSLILHKRINTTLAKAKELRKYVEPLINRSKDDSTHSRRTVFSYLQSKEAVTELFTQISNKVANRPGGYTRILKTGTRLGDNAEMCMVELVDYNENLLSAKTEKAGKSTRRKRTTKKSAEVETPQAKQAPVVVEPIIEDVVEETPEAIEPEKENIEE